MSYTGTRFVQLLGKLHIRPASRWSSASLSPARPGRCRPLPPVLANRLLLDQVFSNLVGNALKFTVPGRRPIVEISAEVVGRYVHLWVRDNGIGIPPEQSERVFGLFERLHTAKEFPGTGVGLAIVRKAAERLGGSIKVESAIGEGSRFCLRLPSAVVAEESHLL